MVCAVLQDLLPPHHADSEAHADRSTLASLRAARNASPARSAFYFYTAASTSVLLPTLAVPLHGSNHEVQSTIHEHFCQHPTIASDQRRERGERSLHCFHIWPLSAVCGDRELEPRITTQSGKRLGPSVSTWVETSDWNGERACREVGLGGVRRLVAACLHTHTSTGHTSVRFFSFSLQEYSAYHGRCTSKVRVVMYVL